MKNMIIEGDNLAVMATYLKEYIGKIDVMPIDPPYNTQIEYINYQDSNFEGGWLKFMEDRLTLAYDLLSEKGVMFINIDENEFCNLFCLCQKIFGKQNVTSMIWKKTNIRFDQNRKEKPLENGVRRTHEFIVVCYKNAKLTKLNFVNQPVWNGEKYVEVSRPLESIIDDMGTTSSAKDELAKLFGSRDFFPTPKPMKMIKELIRAASDKQSIVLDIFAGSGTVAHAVMDLNKEDGGERKFILVTNNEDNICRKVTIPRVKACIAKYGYDEQFDIITK